MNYLVIYLVSIVCSFHNHDRVFYRTKMDFEEHELNNSKGFATDESLKAVVDIIDEHYPNSRKDCLRLLNQVYNLIFQFSWT